MMRLMSVLLVLSMPMAAFAEEAPIAPATDLPAQGALVPADAAQPPPAVAEAKHCGMHRCGGGGKAKWIVLTGATAVVITAVAVGVAVGVASSRAGTPEPITR